LVAAKRLLEESLHVAVDLTTQRAPPADPKTGRGRGDAGFLNGNPLSLAAHPRHARKHPWNRKALAGKTIRDYERSWLLSSAVERGVEIIAEASRHLGRDLKAQHKDVRWKDIAGIGNILRHDYQRVDASIIRKVIKDDLPPLKEALLALRESLK
jgi:uncharacterized protein with HEPN domain